MARLPGSLAKTLLLIAVLMLLGCSSTGGIMSAENLRAALDECRELRLWVLVYQRPDRSVMDVRCIPEPDQVNEYVTLRPKLPMKMIRPFLKINRFQRGIMNNSKTFTLMMGDKELTFQISLDDFNRCVNALQPDNKIAPMHNFLINVSANDETRELVKNAYEDALTSELFGALVKEFKPNVEITVKKYKGGPVKLNKTG